MKGILLLCLILALINLNGCSARTQFIPSDDPNAASVDIYESKNEDGSLISFSFKTIDSRPVLFGYSEGGYKLSPGKHHFLVEAGFKDGISGSIKMALVRVNAQLEANTLYLVKGETSAHQVTVWLEEKKTGEIVSGKVIGKLREPTVYEDAEVIILPLQ